eukprot:CAMPEP_0184325844 /NCGR_PEP_ID=MMETSP1049-20130417/142244_1 /TAXON_ID=77928 /ORGANISM="Proteomonas sulcata, Strain CCMP704" /LENGTH=211 /DNA_ID=CAMNT_0026648005 /DNA_START=112 /DNA_END=744 /DNA_ORIENTATION=-
MGSAVSRFVPKKEVLWTEEDERKVARIQSLWLSFDIDFDGNISLSEMAVHMQKNGKRVDMQSLKLAFDLVDKDRSGRISFCEFCKFNGLRASNEKLREISEQTRQLYNAKLAKMSDVQRFDPEEFDRLYEARVASEATAAGQQRPGHPRRRASDDSARLAHADEAKERRPRRRSLFGNNGSQGALHPAARRRDSTGSAHSNRSEAETVTRW